uniref:Uncharacterized protein n=1 Tax=Trichobilharzia regenti TaxID=157069 RepID=A0AA85JF19_TRIRE|nr:unnamed protein product [Trichobilharzia regenti]
MVISTVFKHTPPNLRITHAMMPSNASNPAETAVIEHAESPHILSSERPGFTGVEQGSPHRSIVYPTFDSQANVATAPEVAQVDVCHPSLHYTVGNLIRHPSASTHTTTQVHKLINNFKRFTRKSECRYRLLPIL